MNKKRLINAGEGGLKKKMRILFGVLFVLGFFFVFASAFPTVQFVAPTPSNASSQSITSIYVNVSSNDSGTHYTLLDFDKSLVGWWRMDDRNSSGGIVDLGSSSTNGSLVGNATINSTGKFGNASWNNGTIGYTYLGQPSKLNMTGSNAFTISAWVYPLANSTGFTVFSRSNAGSSADFIVYWFGRYTTNRWRTEVSNGTVKIDLTTPVNTVDIGQWQLVSVVFNAGNLTIYKNAQILATSTNSVFGRVWDGDSAVKRNTYIGTDRALANYWNGSIDEVMLFNRSLSSQELLALYNSTVNQYYQNFTNLSSESTHTFKAYSVNTLGEVNQTEDRFVSVSVYPTIIMSSPQNTTYTNQTILINFTANDLDGIDEFWFYNETANTSYTSEMYQNVTAGQHTFVFYANDSLNNVASLNVTFVANSSLDNVLPIITINSPLNGHVFRNLPWNISFNISLNENGIVNYSLDGGINNYTTSSVNSLDFNATNISLEDGNYSLSVFAFDASGNLNINSSTSFVVNTSWGNATSIEQWGITFYFNQSVAYGRFANRDFWILGPVNITNITPAYENYSFSGTWRMVNGWEVNPSHITQQGFDERAGGFNSSYVPAFPYTAVGNKSILKVDSWEETGVSCITGPVTNNGPCLYTAAVLTVLDFIPINNGSHLFRPNYFGTNKSFYNSTELKTDLLPSLSNVSNAPNFTSIKTRFERVQLDHKYKFTGQFIRPHLNLPEYPGDLALDTGNAALRFMTNGSDTNRNESLIMYVQAGIDYYHMVINGVSWPSTGGYGIGRKMPMALAAILLNDSSMKSIIQNASNATAHTFGEDGHMYAGYGNIGLYGAAFDSQTSCSDNMYWNNVVNDQGDRDCRDPYGYIDGGLRPSSSYQPIVTNPSRPSLLALFALPTLRTVWNDESDFVNYNLRWINRGGFTSVDVCAPPDGVCVAGSNDGAYCNSAGENVSSCSGGTCNTYCTGGGWCNLSANWAVTYGQTYGLNSTTGTCILDRNLADGLGRFPLWHNNSATGYSSTFGISMWNQHISSYFTDTQAPLVALQTTNNSISQTNSTYFVANLTDSNRLSSALLYVWNSSSSWILYNLTNFSTNTSIVNLSVILPTYGNYSWNYLVTDIYGNQRSNETNFTLIYNTGSDSTSPTVTLLAPINGTNITVATTSFNATFTDNVNLSNATLFVWNSTGIVNQTTYVRIGTSNFTNTTFSFPRNGSYIWNYFVVDNSSNSAWATANFTINYTATLPDTTQPAVAIVYPTNTTYNTNISAVNYTASDTNLAYCWYSNETTNFTQTSCGTNFTGVITREGSNRLIVYANDSSGNINSTSVTFFKDTAYPQFTSYTSNSGTLTTSGTGTFNVTVANSNGTVLMQINGVNYTASNLTATNYNVSVTLTSAGSYTYYWYSFSNSSLRNFNSSTSQTYTVNSATSDSGSSGSSGGGGGGGGASTTTTSSNTSNTTSSNTETGSANTGNENTNGEENIEFGETGNGKSIFDRLKNISTKSLISVIVVASVLLVVVGLTLHRRIIRNIRVKRAMHKIHLMNHVDKHHGGGN